MTQRPTGEELYRAWKAKPGRTKQQVADFHNLTYGQCAGAIYRYEQTLKGAPPEKPQLFNIALGAPLRLTGDWMVVSDVQCPTVDLDMARLVVPVAEKRGIKQLLIDGDFINADWLSGYPVLVPVPSAQMEIKAAAYLIEEWLRWFDQIVIIPGNHEDRYLKANSGNLDMHQLVGLFSSSDRVHVSQFDHCWIDSGAGRWFVTHGKHYSVNQLVVADQYAQKYQANVICGHQHHLAMGFDRYKRHMLIDNGGLFDPAKMAYVSMRASKMPGMMPGFTALVGGYPTLYGKEPFTNWAAVLEDKQPERPALALVEKAA
jgi:predicted phosphodiesterase